MNSNISQELESFKVNFGRRLAQIRRKKGWTGTELGNALGYSKSSVAQWENGEYLPNGETLFGIHKTFDISFDELFGIPSTFPRRLEESSSHGQPHELEPTSPLFRYLWSEEKTEQIEKNAHVVWDATPDFQFLYFDEKWHEIILDNIYRNNCKYYFLYPYSERNFDTAKRISDVLERKLHNDWRKFAHFVSTPAHEFPGWSEHILYDPMGEDPRCILVLPRTYEHSGKLYNIEFAAPMRDAFASWFQMVWNRKVTDANWKI